MDKNFSIPTLSPYSAHTKKNKDKPHTKKNTKNTLYLSHTKKNKKQLISHNFDREYKAKFEKLGKTKKRKNEKRDPVLSTSIFYHLSHLKSHLKSHFNRKNQKSFITLNEIYKSYPVFIE